MIVIECKLLAPEEAPPLVYGVDLGAQDAIELPSSRGNIVVTGHCLSSSGWKVARLCGQIRCGFGALAAAIMPSTCTMRSTLETPPSAPKAVIKTVMICPAGVAAPITPAACRMTSTV